MMGVRWPYGLCLVGYCRQETKLFVLYRILDIIQQCEKKSPKESPVSAISSALDMK